jgi:hypothetical protein
MKQLLTLALLGLFSAALMGCEASARVGEEDDVSRTTVRTGDTDTTYRKSTTTIEPDGDRTTRTETRIDR